MSSMGISVEEGLVVLTLSGPLSPASLVQGQQAVIEAIGQFGRTDVLVISHDFQGWRPGGWDDVSFPAHYDAQIGKMAIVGNDPKWRDPVAAFVGRGLRSVQIEFFQDADSARAWLAAAP